MMNTSPTTIASPTSPIAWALTASAATLNGMAKGCFENIDSASEKSPSFLETGPQAGTTIQGYTKRMAATPSSCRVTPTWPRYPRVVHFLLHLCVAELRSRVICERDDHNFDVPRMKRNGEPRV